MATRTVELSLLQKIDILLQNYRKLLMDLGSSNDLRSKEFITSEYDRAVQSATGIRVEIYAP